MRREGVVSGGGRESKPWPRMSLEPSPFRCSPRCSRRPRGERHGAMPLAAYLHRSRRSGTSTPGRTRTCNLRIRSALEGLKHYPKTSANTAGRGRDGCGFRSAFYGVIRDWVLLHVQRVARKADSRRVPRPQVLFWVLLAVAPGNAPGRARMRRNAPPGLLGSSRAA